MKKFIGSLTASLLVLMSAGVVSAAEGKIVDGRTLVPVRGVFEELGLGVEWDADTATAYIGDDDHDIWITKGEFYFTVNGKTIEPDVPQQIIDGRFYLPLRAVGESIGAEVSWDSDTKTAHIVYEGREIYVGCGETEAPAPVQYTDTSSAEEESVYGEYISGLDITKYVLETAGWPSDCKGSMNIFVKLNLSKEGTASMYFDAETSEQSIKTFIKENLPIYIESVTGLKLSDTQMDEIAVSMGYANTEAFIDAIAKEMNLAEALEFNESGSFTLSGNKIYWDGDEGTIENGYITFDISKLDPAAAAEFEQVTGTTIWAFAKI